MGRVILPEQSIPAARIMTERRADFSPVTHVLNTAISDEFDSGVLNRSRWMTRFAYATGPAVPAPYTQDPPYQSANGVVLPFHGTCQFFNDEQQRYVDEFGGQALHKMGPNGLSLTAVIDGADGTANKYRSAMIQSKYPNLIRPTPTKSYYITARQRLPDVLGSWPAFWLIPALNDDGGANGGPAEIDIQEGTMNARLGTPGGGPESDCILHGSSKVQSWVPAGNFATRYDGVWNGRNYDNKLAPKIWCCHPNYDRLWGNLWYASGVRNQWIEIGLYWAENITAIFHDGTLVYGELYEWKGNDTILANAAHLCLNFAIGGAWANPSGGLGIEDAKFPCSYDVRYVRVYEGQPNTTRIAEAILRAGNILPF